MPPDRDVIFDVVYITAMAIVGGANFWLVYRGYRRCIKHCEDRESPAVVRRDIANITFDAMMAIAWGIFVGLNIGSVARELTWIPAALCVCLLGFIGLLSLRPLRQLVQRRSERQQIS